MNEREINEIFGQMATDEAKIEMGRTWTVKDVRDYLTETGYTGNAQEIMDWLRKFASSTTLTN